MRLVRVITTEDINDSEQKSVVVDYIYTVDTEKKVAMFNDVRSYITDAGGKFQVSPMNELQKSFLINLFLQSDYIDPKYYFLHGE
jgi:hypothetical protein